MVFKHLHYGTSMPSGGVHPITQFLPFSSVLHFTKSSLSAYRGFLIKADRQEATHVWTALRWQGAKSSFALLVGAAMCPACLCGFICRWP
jgi:hypothetical protein